MDERKHDQLSSLPLGNLQRAALEMLWNLGRSSIRDVADRLDGRLGSAVPYNTVASALNALCSAGLATRNRMPGKREYLYSAQVSRDQLEKAVTMKAVQTIFERSRSPRSALSYLVDVVSEGDRRLLDDFKDVVKQKRRVARTEPRR
jgi:predicted transcriptional regulator